MPIRFLRYILESYESNKELRQNSKYPTVFPVLLYSGDKQWTAEFEINRLIHQGIPSKYIPKFRYYPI